MAGIISKKLEECGVYYNSALYTLLENEDYMAKGLVHIGIKVDGNKVRLITKKLTKDKAIFFLSRLESCIDFIMEVLRATDYKIKLGLDPLLHHPYDSDLAAFKYIRESDDVVLWVTSWPNYDTAEKKALLDFLQDWSRDPIQWYKALHARNKAAEFDAHCIDFSFNYKKVKSQGKTYEGIVFIPSYGGKIRIRILCDEEPVDLMSPELEIAVNKLELINSF